MDEKKLNELLVDRVARRVARRKTVKTGGEDPVTRLVARLSRAGKESAVRAAHDATARKVLMQDLSAIVGKDPKLKQDIVEWAKGKSVRRIRYGAQRNSRLADIGGGGGRLGKARGEGGGEFGPKKTPR